MVMVVGTVVSVGVGMLVSVGVYKYNSMFPTVKPLASYHYPYLACLTHCVQLCPVVTLKCCLQPVTQSLGSSGAPEA